MKTTVETTLSDNIIVWEPGDVTHDPKLHEIYLKKEEGWRIGQKVRVTIEAID